MDAQPGLGMDLLDMMRQYRKIRACCQAMVRGSQLLLWREDGFHLRTVALRSVSPSPPTRSHSPDTAAQPRPAAGAVLGGRRRLRSVARGGPRWRASGRRCRRAALRALGKAADADCALAVPVHHHEGRLLRLAGIVAGGVDNLVRSTALKNGCDHSFGSRFGPLRNRRPVLWCRLLDS